MKYFSTHGEYRRRPHNDWIVRLLKKAVRVFSRPMRVKRRAEEGDEPVLYIANHAGARGPYSMIVFFDRRVRPWVISNVCFVKTCAEFARRDFFPTDNKLLKPFQYLLSWLIAPLCPLLFSGVEAIPSYFDKRIIYTLKKTTETLNEGISVLIFPEERKYFSPYIESFQSGFAIVPRNYYKKTGKRLRIVPVYVSRHDNAIHGGEVTLFNPKADFEEEKKRLADYTRDEIERMAEEIPGEPARYTEKQYQSR